MTTYKAISGQSLPDICVNTYGTMNYFFKLLEDSGIDNPNLLPTTGMEFVYDETLVVDQQILRTTTINNIRYATAITDNGNTFYVITGGDSPILPVTPTPPTPIPVSMYQKTSATTYTASTDFETSIALVTLQGKDILQIERNIQPLAAGDYSWNKTTGILTMVNPMMKDEILYILYTEMITL